ncbi:peptidoglycan DD-metalloendopeptidase family protein [Nocardia sp. NPDC004722]
MPLKQGTYSIASGFGPRWGTSHLGLDFAADDGTPFYAAQSGTVAYIGDASGFGQWIVIDHPAESGGGTTVYGHMWNAYATGLSRGDRVEAGQLIGYVGSNGQSTGPHLHFEVHPTAWAAGSQIDPQPWLSGAIEPGNPEPEQPQVGDRVQTHFGIDIASYQRGLDMARVKAEGFVYVIAKATEGGDYVNPEYAAQRDGARANGLLFAAYHYVRDGVSAREQVDNYTATEPDRAIPVMLDVEVGSGGIELTRAVVDEFTACGYRVILIYLPRWFWHGHIGRPDLSGLPPLMSSHYVDGTGYASELYPGDDHPGWSGYGGNTVAVYQFSEKGKVAGYVLDVNAFRGTRTELTSLFGSQEDDLPYTPEDLKALIYECLATYIGPIGSDVKDVREQLCGAGQRDAGQYGGWPQLGGKTVVDKLAEQSPPACARTCAVAECPNRVPAN